MKYVSSSVERAQKKIINETIFQLFLQFTDEVNEWNEILK